MIAKQSEALRTLEHHHVARRCLAPPHERSLRQTPISITRGPPALRAGEIRPVRDCLIVIELQKVTYRSHSFYLIR